jgi:pyridoxal phosphate enzyme (YggS family)
VPPATALPPPELDAPAQARLAACLQAVRTRIQAALAAAGRPGTAAQLLAVTKTFGPPVVAAAARLGQQRFGENYAQEAIAKIAALRAYPGLPALEWHFIGPIQSNKTRLIATHFHWVQSIDRLSIAQRLSDQRPVDLPPLQVLIEVNISGEASKSGVDPAQLPVLALAIGRLPRLRLRGLMAIPQPGRTPADQRAAFARLRALLEPVRQALAADPQHAPGGADQDLDTLSMGMSADFEAAIAEGSTMVRVGSAIFGDRT